MYPNLSNQTQIRLNEINKTKDFFIAEIREREAMSEILSKYITAFDQFEKAFIVLSATSGGVSVASFASVNSAPLGIVSASFSFTFSLTTEVIKQVFKKTRNGKKKHDKIVMLARSKLNSFETLISQGLIDSEISHKE